MVEKLPHAAQPEPGESIFGFILRLTDLNYYDTPSRITSLAGLPPITAPPSFISDNTADLSSLASLADTSMDELRKRMHLSVTHSSTFLTLSFFGHPVPQYTIRCQNPKLCVMCLGEFGFCRAVWDLLPVTTCPLHMCSLLRNCPRCNWRISWNRKKLCLCRCGFDWRKSSAVTVEEGEVKLAQHVHRLCQFPLSKNPRANFDLDNPLLKLDLSHLLSAILFVAGQYEGFISIVGRRWESRRSTIDPSASVAKAALVFEDWPNQFWEFLSWLRDQQSDLSQKGFKKDFGEFYKALFRRVPSTQFDFLRSAFNDYIQDNPLFRSDWRRFKRIPAEKRKYMTKLEAKHRLGGGTDTIDILIETGKLKTMSRPIGPNRNVVLIERDDVEAVRREFRETLSLQETAQTLGIEVQSVTDLIEQKCLQPLRGPTVDSHPAWRFKKASIDDLRRQIKRQIISPLPNSPAITFHHALKILQRVGYDAGRFVRALIDGQVTPCSWNSNKKILEDLNFPKREISGLVDKIVENRNRDTVYAKEGARILRLNTGTINSLCRNGVINAEQARGHARKGWRIGRQAIEEFSTNYASSADLAKDVDTNSKMLTQILLTKGIKPIAAAHRGNNPQYVFKRSDLRTVDWVQIVNEINARLLRSTPNKIFTSAETAVLLGCTSEALATLVTNGLLRPTISQRKRQQNQTGYHFSGHRINRYLRDCAGRVDLVSGAVAAKMLHETEPSFHARWVVCGRLKRIGSKRHHGRLSYYLYSDVQEVGRLKNSSVTTLEATKILRITQQQLLKLCKLGILTPVSGPRIDGCGRNRYLRSAVEDPSVAAQAAQLRSGRRDARDHRSNLFVCARNRPSVEKHLTTEHLVV